MELPFALQIGSGSLRPDIEPDAVFLTVQDAKGTYTVPYIQSACDLEVSARFEGARVAFVRLLLSHADGTVEASQVSTRATRARFSNLLPGEYSLAASGYDGHGHERWQAEYRRIGVGTVIAALGDSITEGYFGNAFCRAEHLTAPDFPCQSVSHDGRNFPQYAPTAHVHLPEVNCFESWMTRLNDLLSQSLGHPVLIVNEGWGGYSSGDYLDLMHTDSNWQDRMLALRPAVWLIELGVNDERSRVDADEFALHIEEIVRTLRYEYGAVRGRILLARPPYDYEADAEEYVRAYCDRIDALVGRLGLSPGPDLFAAFARDRERWYGEDSVHPNAAGMRRTAELWHTSILDALRSTGGDQ